MEYGQGGDALVHSRRDARFALSARAERPHRLSMMEGINAGARSKACLFTGKLLRKEDSSTALWLYMYCSPELCSWSCGRAPIGKSASLVDGQDFIIKSILT